MAETLLLRNADLLCTMQPVGGTTGRAGDDVGREIRGGGLFARDGVIKAVGVGDELPDDADIVLDMQGHVGDPRHGQYAPSPVSESDALSRQRRIPLFGWLQTLYRSGRMSA